MKSRVFIITGCVALLALGSVMALAQTAPQDSAVEVPPGPDPATSEAETQPSPQTEMAASLPDTASNPVEDAPVDVPSIAQPDWAPDINLDAQNQANATQSAPKRQGKPRKILSDAGENALGTNSWGSATNSEAAQAALLARSNRRARPIDPVKRSQLTRLARVMGALHALRVSCSGRDDQTYRSRMATMLDLEAPDSGELRDPLVDAFNGGFQVYGRGATACPSDARVQEAALAKEGLALAQTMSARYRPIPKVIAALPPANQPRKNLAPMVKEAASAAQAAQPTPAQPAPTQATWNNGAQK